MDGNNKVLAANLLAGFISFDKVWFNHPSDFYKVVQAGCFEASQTPELISCQRLEQSEVFTALQFGVSTGPGRVVVTTVWV